MGASAKKQIPTEQGIWVRVKVRVGVAVRVRVRVRAKWCLYAP